MTARRSGQGNSATIAVPTSTPPAPSQVDDRRNEAVRCLLNHMVEPHSPAPLRNGRPSGHSTSGAETSVRFPSYTPDTAVGKAADLLADIIERHGSAGAMVRTMAGSASILGGYLDLSRAMKRSKLDRQLSERISLAVQDKLGCGLCLQAHTSAAEALGISRDEITRARIGGSADPRINAVVDFGRRVHTDPSSISDDDVRGLRSIGLTDRDILDIVGLVALNVLTGTFNLVAGLRLEAGSRHVA